MHVELGFRTNDRMAEKLSGVIVAAPSSLPCAPSGEGDIAAEEEAVGSTRERRGQKRRARCGAHSSSSIAWPPPLPDPSPRCCSYFTEPPTPSWSTHLPSRTSYRLMVLLPVLLLLSCGVCVDVPCGSQTDPASAWRWMSSARTKHGPARPHSPGYTNGTSGIRGVASLGSCGE